MALTDLTRISTSGIATGTSLSGAILHGDAHFRGTNAGINSAIFDSSDNALEFNDDVKLTFGNSGNLQLYYDNSSYITNGTAGHLFIKTLNGGSDIRLESNDDIFLMTAAGSRNSIICRDYAQVELYHNNLKKFETTQTGAVVTGVLTATTFSGNLVGGGSGISTFYDLRVTNNLTVEGSTTTLDTNLIGVDRVEVGANSNSIVGVAVTQSGTADLVNLFDGATKVVTIDDQGNVGLGSAIPSAKLDVNGISKFQDDVIAQKKLSFADSPYIGSTIPPNSLRFGNNDDLILYHTGSYSGIDERGGGTGGLVLHCTNNFTVKGNTSNKLRIIAKEGGAVELYHNNSKKIETTSTGATVTGALVADQVGVGDNEAVYVGGSSDLQMYHDASGSVYGTANSSYIKCQGVHDNILDIFTASATGKIRLKSNNLAETMLVANGNGAVELYYDNVKKFQTQSDGCEINGSAGLQIYGATGANSNAILDLFPTGSGAYSTIRLYHNDGVQKSSISSMYGNSLYISSGGNSPITYRAAGTGYHAFESNSVERLRINSNGVMIRTTTAGAHSSDLTIGDAASGTAGRIMIRSASNAGGYINFQDTTGSSVDGTFEYNHVLNSFNFYFGSQERFRIHTQGMIGLSGANYGTSGQVLTSAGTGSPVSWTTIPQTTINNNADNRIITGSGTANTLEAESTVTFDGTQFRVNAGHTSSIQVDGYYSYVQAAGIKLWRGAGNLSHNMGCGANALANASSGQDCTALGHNALTNSTSGSANTALGSHSMVGTVTGSNNVAVGHGSLNKLTSGYGNSVLGRTAGLEMLGGHSNTLMGYQAGYNITSGNSNAAFGYLALKTLTGNAGCVAVGSNALEVCTGADNCAVGFAAGQQVAGGTNNCLFGSSAGLMIQAGSHNIAIGRDALRMGSSSNVNANVVAGNYSLNQLTNAYNNVVIGYNCSGSNTMTGGSSWHSNVVIGYQAGNIVPSTSSNIVIGKYTCSSSGTNHSDNIVMGTNAGKYLGNYSNNCVILGQEAAQNAGYGSGSNHAYSWTHSIAIGYRAFYNATGAPDSVVAIGSQALKEHNGDGDGSSGGYIVAVGQQALSANEHIRHTVAVGNDAGAYWNPIKGNQHEGGAVFVGGGAGRYGGTAPSLIAIGRNAGQASSANPMSGPHNLCIGSRSGEKLRDGENNTVIGGNYCALFLQTGDWNTILGSLAGYAYDTNNSIQSGSYCTQIGGYTRSSGASNDYENCFGYGVVGKGANTTHIRGSAYNSNNSSSWSTTSDERIKKNIVDNNTGLDAIEKIRVRNFEYRTKNEITDFDDPDAVVVEKEGLQLGVIAQEIKDILPDVVKQNTTGAYAVDPDNLTWYLVNAVKELSAEVKSLKAQLNS